MTITPDSLLGRTLASITPVDEDARAAAAARQLRLTKPPGSLGRLESLGNQLAAIAGACPPPLPAPALVGVFAGDHGVQTAQRVSPWPQEVTRQMAANIARGGAAVSVLARVAGADVRVFDVGMLAPVDLPDAAGDPLPGVRDTNVRHGTEDLNAGPAMSVPDAVAALEVGVRAAREAVAEGYRCLVMGEVGIGNTTPAAALISVFTGVPARDVTGRGAGADDGMLARKVEVIERGIAVNRASAGDPLAALAGVGGLEHAAMAGFVLGGAAARVPVVVDGVIACSAALVAAALAPAASGYLIGGHDGVEAGIAVALRHLGLDPVVSLDLRLGEGSGAVTVLPIVRGAAAILREMATFDSAAVSESHPPQAPLTSS